MNFVKVLLIIIMATFFIGCVTAPDVSTIRNADYGSFLSEKHSENIIKNYYSNTLKDPSSVKYREFTKPKKFWYGTRFKPIKYGYLVCVVRNAKNSYGAYTGFKTDGFFIRNGIIKNRFPDGKDYLSGKKVC